MTNKNDKTLRDKINKLESELANAKIEADSAKEQLLIEESNEAARKRYAKMDLIYLAIFIIGMVSLIASLWRVFAVIILAGILLYTISDDEKSNLCTSSITDCVQKWLHSNKK